MPVMGNLGNISYVLTALLGGLIAINGIGWSDIRCSGILPAVESILYDADYADIPAVKFRYYGIRRCFAHLCIDG